MIAHDSWRQEETPTVVAHGDGRQAEEIVNCRCPRTATNWSVSSQLAPLMRKGEDRL